MTDKELFEIHKKKMISSAIDACERHQYPDYDEPLACLIEDCLDNQWKIIELLLRELDNIQSKCDAYDKKAGINPGQRAQKALANFREALK